jgi:AcrR family transcriptional regulator
MDIQWLLGWQLHCHPGEDAEKPLFYFKECGIDSPCQFRYKVSNYLRYTPTTPSTMPRPSQSDQQRRQLLPVLCGAFSELGYRRTTTAELARRCGVRENILYRLWADKKAMFLAAIEDIFSRRAETWQRLLAEAADPHEAAERLIAYEARHQGEFGFFRVVFAALNETDDAAIRAALVCMYRRFHQLVRKQIESFRSPQSADSSLAPDAAAWALLGLATMSNVIRHLDLLKPQQRERMFAAVALHVAADGIPTGKRTPSRRKVP